MDQYIYLSTVSHILKNYTWQNVSHLYHHAKLKPHTMKEKNEKHKQQVQESIPIIQIQS